MLNMMNRGFLPYRTPDGGGPALMQIGPDTTAAGAGTGTGTAPGAASSSYTNQSLTPIPFMQPFSQTQEFVQPFSAQQQQPPRRQGGGQFMQGMLNFMAKRGIDRFIDPRLRMRRAQPQPYGGQFGGSFAPRTLPMSSNFGGSVPANVGNPGMADFSGVNPYGTTY